MIVPLSLALPVLMGLAFIIGFIWGIIFADWRSRVQS